MDSTVSGSSIVVVPALMNAHIPMERSVLLNRMEVMFASYANAIPGIVSRPLRSISSDRALQL